MKSDSLPDALADALGRVVAEVQREWRKDVERLGAEGRAVVAELRAEIAELKGELKEKADQEIRRISEALANVKDGAPGRDGVDGRDGRDGVDGKDGTPGLDGAPGRDGVDGKDGEPGKPGEPGTPGEKGDPGTDGKDADPEIIVQMVAAEVAKAVAEIPVQKGDKGEPGEAGAEGRPGRDGADGVGVAGAVIDRSGELVLTLTDGSTRSLGDVIGKDGQDGAKGADGAPGRDGLGIDNFDVTYDGERTFNLKWSGANRVEERVFVLPVVLDRGVYAAGKEYQPGDGVTFGGSYWIAQETTTDKPEASKAWRLSAKRGRDGKDGVVKYEGPPKPVKVG